MSSLSAGYDNVLSAWDTTADASKTLDVLSLRMYQQDARLKNRQKTEKVIAFTAIAPKNPTKTQREHPNQHSFMSNGRHDVRR